MKNDEIFVGDTAAFSVKVTGEPTPTVRWFKKDVQLEPSKRISFEEGKGGRHGLVIENVTKKDKGKYKCFATNSAGEVHCSATLTVEEVQ